MFVVYWYTFGKKILGIDRRAAHILVRRLLILRDLHCINYAEAQWLQLLFIIIEREREIYKKDSEQGKIHREIAE